MNIIIKNKFFIDIIILKRSIKFINNKKNFILILYIFLINSILYIEIIKNMIN